MKLLVTGSKRSLSSPYQFFHLFIYLWNQTLLQWIISPPPPPPPLLFSSSSENCQDDIIFHPIRFHLIPSRNRLLLLPASRVLTSFSFLHRYLFCYCIYFPRIPTSMWCVCLLMFGPASKEGWHFSAVAAELVAGFLKLIFCNTQAK